jgi:malonate transporter and related proteins
MSAALQALLPVLIIIVVGWTTVSSRLVPREQWVGIDAITYYVLFPCLLVTSLVGADLRALPFATLGLALVLSVLAMSALCLALRPALAARFGIDGPRFSSLFQGATRWNTTVGLALAGFLYGPKGVALMSVAIIAMIPLLNVSSVAVLSWFAAASAPSAKRIILELMRNPLILACAAGIALNLASIPLPAPVASALELLGRAGLASGLLAVGAGLDLSSLRRLGPALASGTLLRLVLMPLFAFAFTALLGVTGTARGVAILAAAVPAASSSYILARRMGGDARLMAEIITLQTLLAVVTLPFFLWLLA